MSSESSEGEKPRLANPDEPRSITDRGSQGSRHEHGLTRRAILSGAAAVGLGAGVTADRLLEDAGSASGSGPAQTAVPFHGSHQAGIATPQQRHLSFAVFDLATSSGAQLRQLLERWTAAAAALTAGKRYTPGSQGPSVAPVDTGEAAGLSPARLTLTFGFGPTLFEADGRDRIGLARLRPEALMPLPSFSGDLLDPARTGGDLCVQACADDPQVAFHAIHMLSRIAGSDAKLRWTQTGFRSPACATQGRTPRNLIGFKDGTDNIRPDDHQAMNRFVWVGAADQPAWMRGGTYLIARKIEIVLENWDAQTLTQQEHVIGRHKQSGAPLGASLEHDPVDLRATDRNGNLLVPADAHIRLAGPAANQGQRILRRGYSFSTGTAPSRLGLGDHQLDAGLFFIAFVRDPARQFVPIQRRLANHDALSGFTVHTASAVFACPPGVRSGGFIGQQLLAYVRRGASKR